jgi:hypothetical protein
MLNNKKNYSNIIKYGTGSISNTGSQFFFGIQPVSDIANDPQRPAA